MSIFKKMRNEMFRDNGGCSRCEYAKTVPASGGYVFLGCYREPYKGKMCAEIEECDIRPPLTSHTGGIVE